MYLARSRVPLVCCTLFFANLARAGQAITRVSLDELGIEAVDRSLKPDLSADGNIVVFIAEDSLLAIDTNSYDDVYAYDRMVGTLELISQNGLGNPGNFDSGSGSNGAERPRVSDDGNLVVFRSTASNLVAGQSQGLFVYNRALDTIRRVDRHTNGTPGNAAGEFPQFSADGDFVAFMSGATNLVDNDTNGTNDVFVTSLVTGVTERISVDKDGNEGNGQSKFVVLSFDGRYAAFSSFASNLIPGDTNGWDVFRYDRQDGSIERVNVDSDENQATGSSGYSGVAISADGNFVAFDGGAVGQDSCSSEVFVRDIAAGTTERGCTFDGDVCHSNFCDFPELSADGRYVVYESSACSVPPLDSDCESDVFVYDRFTGALVIASENSSGVNGDSYSEYPSISADGKIVAFQSMSTNLVSGDTNAQTDIFVAYELQFPTPTPSASHSLTGTPTLTHTPTLTATASHSRSRTATPSSTATASPTPTGTPTLSPTSSRSPTPTAIPTSSQTKTPTGTSSATRTETMSYTGSPTPTKSATDSETETASGPAPFFGPFSKLVFRLS